MAMWFMSQTINIHVIQFTYMFTVEGYMLTGTKSYF